MPTPGSEPAENSRNLYPPMNNRRRSVRQRVHLPATASFSAGSTGVVRDIGDVIDLSEHGACIRNSASLSPRSLVTLSLDLMESKAFISATGEVIWSDSNGKHGIHFSDISEESRQRIKQWLFANAISVGINQGRNIPPARELPPRLHPSTERSDPKPEAVRQSPEQARAAIAASTKEEETSTAEDYSAVLSSLVAVKRKIEVPGTSLGGALQLLCDRALSLTYATGAAIAIATEPRASEMVCRARAGSDAPGLDARLQVGSGFSGECVRTGTVLCCDDAETDPRVDREGSRLLGIRSMMAAPIRQDNIVTGLLEVFSSQPHSFGTNDQNILERLAEMAAASLRRARTLPAPLEGGNAADAVQAPRFEALPEAEQELELPREREIVHLLEPEASPSRRVLQVAIAVIAFIALIVLAVSWTTNHKLFGNVSPATSSVPPSPPKGAPAPANPITDLQQLRKLAADGDPNAQFDLGARYATGEDVKQDYSESVHWFTLAAEQGHVIAQATLGAYYWAGRGTPQDLSKAYFWSAIAQAGGDEASKYRVEVLTSRMTPEQVAAAAHEADDWIKKHQPPANPAQ